MGILNWDLNNINLDKNFDEDAGHTSMREHGTKTTLLLSTSDGKTSWSPLPSLVFLLLGSTMQPENTYSCILKVTGQVWESQKRISISTNHSYYQRSSPIIIISSLNWSNNKIRFSFNQTNRKRWSVRLVDVIKHPPHKVFSLWCHH